MRQPKEQSQKRTTKRRLFVRAISLSDLKAFSSASQSSADRSLFPQAFMPQIGQSVAHKISGRLRHDAHEAAMIAQKTARFLLKYASSDPLRLADIVRRRAIEQFSTPPTGLATTHFNGVHYEIDMSLHRVMQKYYFRTHEMFLE